MRKQKMDSVRYNGGPARKIDQVLPNGRQTAYDPDDVAFSARDRQVGGDHYQNMGVQPWDAMQAWMTAEQFEGFLRGNVIKYIARYDSKGGLEDLRKAQHYLGALIELVERTQQQEAR